MLREIRKIFNLRRCQSAMKKDERIQQLKGAMNEVKWLTKKEDGVQVTFSQEDLDFLCSEKGLERIRKDAEDFYLKNAEQQKVIAADQPLLMRKRNNALF